MASEETEGIDESTRVREPRPVVFPTVVVPGRFVVATAVALLGAAGLAVIAALVRAATYRLVNPPDVGGQGGVTFSQPPLTFADRLSVFTSNGAGVTIAILVAVAVVLMALSTRPEDRPAQTPTLLLMSAIVIAALIVIANAVMFVEVVANAQGALFADEIANKGSSAIGHLEPVLVAAGAIWYSIARLNAHLRDGGREESKPG